jgi:MFS family permease
MFCLLLLCSICFGYLALEQDNKKATILSGIFFGLATLTKITAPIIFLILGLYFLYSKYYKDKNKWKILILIGVIAVLIVSPWLIRNFVLYDDICYGLSGCAAVEDASIPWSMDLVNQYAGRTSGTGVESSLMALGTLAYTQFAYGWVMIFLALFGVAYAIRERSKPEMLIIMLLISTIPIFMFYSTRVEDAARYTLPAIIGMAAVSGIFLSKVYDHLRAKHLMIAMIIILLILPGVWYFGQEKLNTMQSVKSFSSGFFDACSWVQSNTPEDSLLLSIYAQQTAYACNRRVSTAIPDMAEIMLTNNETSYQHLKLHGYNYIFIMVGLISQTPYKESVPLAFYQYMESSQHFVRVYDNTATFGNDGVLIYEVKY